MTEERLVNARKVDKDTIDLMIEVARGLTGDNERVFAEKLDNEYTDGGAFIYLYHCAETGGIVRKLGVACLVDDTENDWNVLRVDVDYDDWTQSVVLLRNEAWRTELAMPVHEFGFEEWYFGEPAYREALKHLWQENGYD